MTPISNGRWNVIRCPFQLSRSERYSPPKYDIEQSDAGCNFAHNSLIPFRLAFMNRQHAGESTFNLKGGYMISQGSREHEISTLESTITYPVYSRHDVCRRLWVSRLPFFKLDDERRVGRGGGRGNMWTCEFKEISCTHRQGATPDMYLKKSSPVKILHRDVRACGI